MELYADLHGVPKEKRPERFHKLLTMMGLERFTDRLAGNLSGGMKQKSWSVLHLGSVAGTFAPR